MMFSAHTGQALTEVERQLNAVSAALLSGEAPALASASAALRQAAIDFSQCLQSLTSAERADHRLKSRLKQLAAEMAARRETLIRRGVLVERALNAIVPATRSATYAPAAAPYASVGRQSGAFKYLAA